MPANLDEQEYEYWSGQFQTLRHAPLTTVQTAGANWAKVFAAVMGVFGVVAFTTGSATLKDLPSGNNLPLIPGKDLVADVKVLVVTAFAAALLATILSSLASGQLFPRTRFGDSPIMLAQRTSRNAKRDLWLLRVGQVFGLISIIAVLSGSIAVFLAPAKADAPVTPPSVLATFDTESVCGPLNGSPDDPKVLDRSLAAAQLVVVVAVCP